MSALDVVDETFVAAAPAAVAALVADESSWPRWWPDLALTVVEQRGPSGIRWQASGAVSATVELWLEPVLDGTVMHFFLRADEVAPAGTGVGGRASAAVAHHRRLQAKSVAFEIKAALEKGRSPGLPPAHVSG